MNIQLTFFILPLLLCLWIILLLGGPAYFLLALAGAVLCFGISALTCWWLA